MITQIGKFTGGGLIGTLCHYIILLILVGRRFDPIFASGCGMIGGAIIVYLINYYITFASSKKHVDVMKRFLPMVVVGFYLNHFILGLAMEDLAYPLLLSQIIATSGQFIFNFGLSRLWIF